MMNVNPLVSESVIRELARGDMSAEGSGVFDTPELAQLNERQEKAYAELLVTMSDEQRAILYRYEDALCDRSVAREMEVFAYAFKLGARMAMEMWGRESNA